MTLRRISRIALVFLCCIWLAVTEIQAAPSLPAIRTDRQVGFTVEYKNAGVPLSEVAFSLYKVADTDANGVLTVTGQFRKYSDLPIQMEPEDPSSLALTLAGYAKSGSLTAAVSEKTDANGRVSFTVDCGMYLVIGEKHTADNTVYTVAPYLVFLPVYSESDGDWSYSVISSPKSDGRLTKPDEPETLSRRVLKKWVDDGRESLRPREITVYLLRDGELFDAVSLSEENAWSHTWAELDAACEWLVSEKEVDGYSSLVEQYGGTFLVTNTCTDEAPPPEAPPPGTPMLPQTGTNRYIAPALSCLGLGFIILGLYLRRKDGKAL